MLFGLLMLRFWILQEYVKRMCVFYSCLIEKIDVFFDFDRNLPNVHRLEESKKKKKQQPFSKTMQ